MKTFECKSQQLTAMGNRLLDWFSVIMSDNKKRNVRVQKSKGKFIIGFISLEMCTEINDFFKSENLGLKKLFFVRTFLENSK